MARKFITKKQPDSHQRVQLSFKEATQKQIFKELGIENEYDIPVGYVAGWASTSDLDHAGHVVDPGAFDESIKEKGLTGPKGIKILIGHDRQKPAGVIKKLETRDGKLWIEAQLELSIGYVSDFYKASKINGGLSFSVGFYLEDYEYEVRDGDYEFLRIKKAELEEISIVTFACNEECGMVYLKDKHNPTKHETLAKLEKALVASGLVKSRNDANRVTQVVKANMALFGVEKTNAAKKPAPAVAKDKLNKLGTLVGEMSSLFKTHEGE